MSILAACALAVAACVTIPKDMDLGESLRSAAVDYWKLRMEERYDETYAVEDGEGLPPYKDYLINVMAMRRMRLISHSVKEVRVEGDKGVVEVEFSYSMDTVKKPFRQSLTDHWVFKGGKWRHILLR